MGSVTMVVLQIFRVQGLPREVPRAAAMSISHARKLLPGGVALSRTIMAHKTVTSLVLNVSALSTVVLLIVASGVAYVMLSLPTWSMRRISLPAPSVPLAKCPAFALLLRRAL